MSTRGDQEIQIDPLDETIHNESKTENTLYLVNLVAFLLVAGICVASFTVPSLRKAAPCGLALWQWTLFIAVLLIGPLLSKLLEYLVNCLADTEYTIKDNIIYYVVELAKNIWVVLWFGMILVAWLWVVHQPDYLKMPMHNDRLKRKYIKIFDAISTFLTSLLIGSILWLIKNGVLTRRKSSFHIKKFFVRVRRALMHQVVINKFSAPDTFDNVGGMCGVINGSKCCEEKMPSLGKVSQKNVSSLGMQKVIRWFLNNERLTYYDVKLKKHQDIASEKEARNAVHLIFRNGSAPKKIRDVLVKYEKNIREEPKDQVSELMCFLLDKPSEPIEMIRTRDIEELMVKMFNYRETLGRALRGNKKLFRAVNRVINILLILFILALWLIMLRGETRNIIFVIATAIAGSAFLIGDTCKTILDCWMFIFIVHPFDIGDCCLIDNTLVTIKQIGVLETKALTFDNELKYYSNSNLFRALSIINYTRSEDPGDCVVFYPDYEISVDSKIEDGISGYIENKENYWNKDYSLVKEFDTENKMKMRLHVKHKISAHDFKERQRRKSELVQELTNILIKEKRNAAEKEQHMEKNNEREEVAQ